MHILAKLTLRQEAKINKYNVCIINKLVHKQNYELNSKDSTWENLPTYLII